MSKLAEGWRVQIRVFMALVRRELITRFGRENIGFLWIMIEPMMFAIFVGLLWRLERGATDHGVNIVAFVTTGYLPMVLFRSSVARAVSSITSNAGLMYHRQIKILDLVMVRFFIEYVGHMLAYVFIASALFVLGFFPFPHDIGMFILGWTYYAVFSFSVMLVMAPLSEMSEIVERFVGITTYIMIPFSGAFTNVDWLSPGMQKAVLWSPPVHGMEMMRYGIFGDIIHPHYDFFYPLAWYGPMIALGLVLCRRLRRTLVVE